jgi:hypothetical protein
LYIPDGVGKELASMGFLRLSTPGLERLADDAIERTYMAGLDCVPTYCRKTWDGDGRMRLERETRESGNVYVPWTVDGHGELLLSTATLMERERPYDLAVEVARGTVNRLRSKAETWSLAGLRLSDSLAWQIRAACQSFIRAATSQQDPDAADAASQTAIRQALDAMTLLGAEYAKQALEYRHQGGQPLPTLLVGNVGDEAMPANIEPMFRAAFNAAAVPFHWGDIQPEPDRWEWAQCDKQVQWCVRNGLKVICGPLVRLDRQSVPIWLASATSADLAAVAKAARKFVEAAVERYRGQVHLWHGVATATAAPWLGDDQILRLTVLLVEAARRRDPRTPVFISVAQPWGESLAFQQASLSPLQFVDFLLRADVEIAGIGLEIDYGYWPGGTLPRDVLEITEHIDLWALLGMPLIPMLTLPSSLDADALATDRSQVLRSAFPAGPSPQNQRRLLDQLLPALLAKQSVQAIVCNQVFDSVPHRYAHGGLFTAQALPKPALNSLLALRREHLT